MYRSQALANLRRLISIARFCDSRRLPTPDGVEQFRALEAAGHSHALDRREWLERMGRIAAAGAVAAVAAPVRSLSAWRGSPQDVSVGIVGAGLAGLACADRLKDGGIRAALYEASARTGGRCLSLRGFFPGQVAERGGEFIDTLHKTMIGYARRFNLTLEDVSKAPGDVRYFFDGQAWPEPVVVDQFRQFVGAMRDDLRRLSREVTAANHSAADVELDNTDLLAYLEGDNADHLVAGPIVKAAIVQAYIAEYGLDPSEQSCLNFLLFIHADRRSKFTPFGVFSDERYHVLDGNDRIVEGLTNAVAGQIELGMELVRVRRTPADAVELTFKRGAQTVVRSHDVVVLAIPFTVLRDVELDVNLGLSAAKQHAIDELGYGTNAKMMVGFSLRPWTTTHGSNGSSYSDLPNHQATWETNPARAQSTRAILTDYSGAARGASLNLQPTQTAAEAFLADLELVYPGAAAAATRIGGQLRVHLEHWPSNPLTRGSYTCYQPGQFTSIAGLEGELAGPVYFAGEHANSFYEFQGFMEGAAVSGLEAAAAILKVTKHGRVA